MCAKFHQNALNLYEPWHFEKNEGRQVNGQQHIDGLVQDCSNSSVLSMELLQSCTKPSLDPSIHPSAFPNNSLEYMIFSLNFVSSEDEKYIWWYEGPSISIRKSYDKHLSHWFDLNFIQHNLLGIRYT